MMTRRKRSSTNKYAGWPKGEVWWSKSREEPWRAQAASPRQSKSNRKFAGNRVDTIFRAGLGALLFFFEINRFSRSTAGRARSAHGETQAKPAASFPLEEIRSDVCLFLDRVVVAIDP